MNITYCDHGESFKEIMVLQYATWPQTSLLIQKVSFSQIHITDI